MKKCIHNFCARVLFLFIVNRVTEKPKHIFTEIDDKLVDNKKV